MDLCAEAKDAGIKTLVALDDQVTNSWIISKPFGFAFDGHQAM